MVSEQMFLPVRVTHAADVKIGHDCLETSDDEYTPISKATVVIDHHLIELQAGPLTIMDSIYDRGLWVWRPLTQGTIV